MSSEFGKVLRTSVFVQSHGKAIGVLIDGLPAGFKIDEEKLLAFMERRKAKGKISTPRHEADLPIFLSGVVDGVTAGSPLCAIIENKNAHSTDYDAIKYTPRPSHADYTAFVKWNGDADMRGGGHFSGRLTAPICIAGGIAIQMLEEKGIYIGAHLKAVGGVEDRSFTMIPSVEELMAPGKKQFPVIDDDVGEKMTSVIEEASRDGDSVGGIIECTVIGTPAGVGAPMFEGVENRLAGALFGIPAVKGVEFGAGCSCADMRGSQCNDSFSVKNGRIVTVSNNSGGIQGGITNGMPINLRVAIKPTPSISKEQMTVDVRNNEETKMTIKGRHDPCIAHRAVPVVEAVCALTLLDMILEEGDD